MTVYEGIMQGLEEAIVYNKSKAKIDCSNVLNYVAETERMCKSHNHNCGSCPLEYIGCDVVSEITQRHIDVVQRWSDENSILKKTNKDYFFEAFPNAPKANGGYPVLCVRNVGLRDYLTRCERNCTDCWDEQYEGE